jgi:hypothetical protein
MNLSRRQILFGAIILGVLVLLTLLAAPTQSTNRAGSTFSRSPSGYGAWYAFMEQRGTPVQRWQKPFSDFVGSQSPSTASTAPKTFLQIYSGLTSSTLSEAEASWVEAGNQLIILGVQAPVTAAQFRSLQTSPAGMVQVDTRRRHRLTDKAEQSLLGDRFGAVVWQKDLGKGQVIRATTPHLAANAYQNQQANYEFLARLVSQAQQPIWVDEYLHGYRDSTESSAAREASSWLAYLGNTALLPVLLQTGVLLALLIWAQNRRFGSPIPVSAPVVDNSTAYITALAGVLYKAQSSQFVVETIAKAEQLQVQRSLGLGSQLLDLTTLLTAWEQQTGRPAAELAQVLQPKSPQKHMSDRELQQWLENIQTIRRHLPNR